MTIKKMKKKKNDSNFKTTENYTIYKRNNKNINLFCN